MINQAVAFVNERTGRRAALRRPRKRRRATGRARCTSCCRRSAARSRRERAKVLTVDTSDRVHGVRLLRARPRELVTVGAPCPDHLVHTKRLPLWIPYARGRATPRARSPSCADGLPRRLPRVLRGARRRGRRAGRPGPADRARRGHRAGRRGHDDQAVEDLARPLPPRDRGDGRRAGARRVRLARRRRELRDRVLAARALQARAGAAARRAAGQGRARHRRRRRHRPRDRRLARRARARASSRSTSTATGARDAVAAYGDRGLAVAGDVTSEDAVAAAFAAAVDALRRRRHRRLQRRHRLQRVDRGDHAGRVEPQPRDPRHRLLPRRAARRSACSSAQDAGGSIVFIASKNALVAGKNAAAYSSAKAAELHLARCLAEEGGARRHPRQHRQPGRGPAGLEDLGLLVARGARRGVQPRPRGARRALPPAQHAEGQHLPGGHRRGRPALRLRAPLGQEHGQHPQRRRRRAAPPYSR